MSAKKLIFEHNFFCLLLFEATFTVHHFSTIKSQKEYQNIRNQDFSYYFCMMIEGSGSRAGSGSIPSTSGSGSRRPQNMWIRWIRIRIRIRNTALYHRASLGISFFLILETNSPFKCLPIYFWPLCSLDLSREGLMLAAATTSSFSYHQTTFRNQGTYYLSNLGFFLAAVFRISDILRRIRILEWVHWVPDSGPALFVSVFFCLFPTLGTFTSH
jgi:hypothetical protein